MIKCVVVDDEQYSIDTLTQYINKTAHYEVIGSYTNPMLALQDLQEGLSPDILFLDVDMPELSGIELATLIPEHICVIYVTAYGGYALKAFETNVYDFLLKPVSYPKFLKSLQKINQAIKPAPSQEKTKEVEYIFINPGIKGKVIKLYIDDILFVEGLKNYVIFNLQQEKYVSYLTMWEIEAALPAKKFLRIHRSTIINFSKVQAMEGNMVILQNNLKLQLGGYYKESLKKMIAGHSIISSRASQ